MRLSTTSNKAKEQGVPVREYRPEKGECWIDVMERAKKFLNEVTDRYIFNKEGVEESKKVEVKKEQKKDTMQIYGKSLLDTTKPLPKKDNSEEEKKVIRKKTKSIEKGIGPKKVEVKKIEVKKTEVKRTEMKKTNGKKADGEKGEIKKVLSRVLAVTHGGFIMEFVNLYRSIREMGICERNIAKNTAIYAFQIGCANCKGVCKETLCKDKRITINMIKENDNKHLISK
jgi:hypothetical protein